MDTSTEFLADFASAAFTTSSGPARQPAPTRFRFASRICRRASCLIIRAAVALARGTPLKVLVNERIDVALLAGASGVHLRANGPPVDRVRAIVPAGFLIGRSAHSDEEIERARSADYLVFGTVFATPSKPGEAGQGLAALRRAVERFRGPVLAVGGVTPANASSVLATGAAGYAAIGAFEP